MVENQVDQSNGLHSTIMHVLVVNLLKIGSVRGKTRTMCHAAPLGRIHSKKCARVCTLCKSFDLVEYHVLIESYKRTLFHLHVHAIP